MQAIERNELFDLAYRFVTETSENIFLTGKAGTGKTTFLKYLQENSNKNILVAAPTGVAALNAGGVTLHSLFQLPFHPFLPTVNSKRDLLQKIRYNKQRLQLLRKMELLVIDEISMVRSDVVDAIDTVLRSVRGSMQPFGGVQLLCIGDLHQLSPVAQNHEWSMLAEYYESPFFFDSLAIKEQMPLLIELTTIYRQKEASFINLLNKVRHNNMDEDDLEDLHARYVPGFTPPAGEHFITLTSHNKQADLINQVRIQQLSAPTVTYKAIIEDEFPEQLYPAEAELELKEGAQVMFLKNDPVQKRYYNGKIGIVQTLEEKKILVDCEGTVIEVNMETWENTRYTLNRTDGKLEQETIGSFAQYPLRLAWAITIHKSQGLTFEKVMIDAGAAFSSGQVYVALSRCTSLEGIVLLSKIPASAIHSNERVIRGQQLLTHKGSLAERFEGARQVFTQELLDGIFSFSEIAASGKQLAQHIQLSAEKLNRGAGEWIEKLNTSISADKEVGSRFMDSVARFMKEEAVIENNPALQKRINDAARHFIPKFMAIQQSVQNHPLITEHKEVAVEVNEYLQHFYLALHSANHSLDYCATNFSISGFLQHKLKYQLPRININCYASTQKQTADDVNNPELYETLRRWRNMIIEETGLPIYLVANQSSLKEICTYLPMNKKELQAISGFGKAKAEKYGDDILGAVESYCSRYGLESNMFAKTGSPGKQRKEKPAQSKKTNTRAVSYQLFKEGKSIPDIARERKLTIGTIEGHLTSFISSGELNISELVSENKQVMIKEALAKRGESGAKELLEQLPGDFSFGEIRMVRASMNIAT